MAAGDSLNGGECGTSDNAAVPTFCRFFRFEALQFQMGMQFLSILSVVPQLISSLYFPIFGKMEVYVKLCKGTKKTSILLVSLIEEKYTCTCWHCCLYFYMFAM